MSGLMARAVKDIAINEKVIYVATQGGGLFRYGGGPVIVTSPASSNFGSIKTGSSSTPQTFTISNTGTENLNIGAIILTGTSTSEFGIQNDKCSNQTIAPLGTCTVQAVFLPASAGLKSANLSIPSNDPDTSTLEVALTGTGIDNPAPDIKANGSDGPITIGQSAGISITISLDPASQIGKNADWWIAVYTPFGWYHLEVVGGVLTWAPDVSVTYQGPLLDIDSGISLDTTNLFRMAGSYDFYFVVDMNMNGLLDYDRLYYDHVVVNLTP